MLKRCTIAGKQTIAFCLILLFIAVHVIKLAHTHPDFKIAKPGLVKQFSSYKHQAECAICDFHFSKNSDYCNIPVFKYCIGTHQKTYYTFNCSLITSIGLVSSDRGPPSIC